MSPKLEDRILRRFKTLFPNGKNVDKTKNLMYYGFSVGDGWYKLLYDTFEKIEMVLQESMDLFVPTITFFQVKQKFATLRIYYDIDANEQTTKKISDIMNSAEQRSMYICEECGEDGTVVGDYWVSVKCKKCRSKDEV